MAFQMIPPRLSSSPPPLDSLPSVTFPGDDDDEDFGSFSTHNSSFDITGLSDKLPQTPQCSPTKLRGVRVSARVAEEAQEDTSSQEDTSPQLCSDHGDDDFGADFGDFQSMNNSITPPGVPDVNSSLDTECTGSESDGYSTRQAENQVSGSEGKGMPGDSFAKTGTPPPLDQVAADEFSRFSPNLAVSTEDDFGEFASSEIQETVNVGGNESQVVNGDSGGGGGVSKGANATEDGGAQESIVPESSTNSDTAAARPDSCTDDSSRAESCSEVRRTFSDHKPDGGSEEWTGCTGTAVDIRENIENEVTDPTDENCDSTYLSCAETIDTKEKRDENCVFSGESESVKFDCPTDGFDDCSENTTEEKAVHNPWTEREKSVGDSNKSLDKGRIAVNTPSESVPSASNDKTNIDNEVIVKERTAHSESELGDGGDDLSKFDCEDDSNFGDFDRANDDDDLDFDDLRKQVEEGTFGEDESLQSNPDDEFGDFGDYNKNTYEAEDTIGDVSAASGNINESEFGKFSVTNIEDEDEDDNGEFGDFAGHDWQGNEAVSQDPGFEDDEDFGDFNQPGTEKDFESSPAPGGEGAAGADSWGDAGFMTSTTNDPVMQKLEALVRKWVPSVVPATPPSSPAPAAPPSLRQVVESDAFVWRWLETKLDSCPGLTVSWGTTRAHASFLAALGVDARNILFGQKWSSSVPLFAQTLSFSPLTPAKPGERSGGAVVVRAGSREPTTPPVTLNPVQTREESPSDVMAGKDGVPEEQIPPAKFDWTSSGLTNPLEGPGLEEEFLSDGGEEGGPGGHLPSRNPPTPSPLVQQILGGGGVGSGAGLGVGGGLSGASRPAATPLTTLTSETRQVVETLPDLSYMRSKVLMFPIRHHH